jgi:hypothetical protein
MATD